MLMMSSPKSSITKTGLDAYRDESTITLDYP
jgi:hypothetical protein